MPITIDGTNGISGLDGSAATPSIQGSDTNTGVFYPAADTVGISTGGTEKLRVDSTGNLRFNSGYGSVVTAYACRAWVNFNGTGTIAIRASGNISSITDNGTGDYTLNFTTAMPDVNYSFACSAQEDTIGAGNTIRQRYCAPARVTPVVGGIRIRVQDLADTFSDAQFVAVNIFR